VTPPEDKRLDLEKRVEAIEAGYEFMLAYAAQGLPQEAGSASGAQIRDFLKRFDDALTGLAHTYKQIVDGEHLPSPSSFGPFLEVLDRDAQATQAAIRMVLAQPAISSQLVDNLNASIHVRALLTDVFLIDEAVKKAPSSA
jgi:hypothetical protein